MLIFGEVLLHGRILGQKLQEFCGRSHRLVNVGKLALSSTFFLGLDIFKQNLLSVPIRAFRREVGYILAEVRNANLTGSAQGLNLVVAIIDLVVVQIDRQVCAFRIENLIQSITR